MLVHDATAQTTQPIAASSDHHQEVARVYELLGLTEERRSSFNAFAMTQPAQRHVADLRIGLTNNSNDK